MANLVHEIFQGLPVKAPHSPVALPFHPQKSRLGPGARLELVKLVRRPLFCQEEEALSKSLWSKSSFGTTIFAHLEVPFGSSG